MGKILGAASAAVLLLLSGCGGSGSDTTSENPPAGDSSGLASSGNDVPTTPPAESTPANGTTTYVTTKDFVEALQKPTATPVTTPAPAPAAEEKALAADFNNELAFTLLRLKTKPGHSAFTVANRAQQMAMFATSADEASKAQIVSLLLGNGSQDQLVNPPPHFSLTTLLNTATTPVDGGYLATFSTWGQYDYMFPQTSLEALNLAFGSQVFAVDFVNNASGSNELIKAWQALITPRFTIEPKTTRDTRLVFSSADRLNSDWAGNPALMIQANFYYDLATVAQNYYELQSSARINDSAASLAAEVPLDRGNSLFLVMPHSTACPATSAITANSTAFDHPFVFFIINNNTGIIIYTGVFAKPNDDACDTSVMSSFLNNLNIGMLNTIRSHLTANETPLYVPEFNFVSWETINNTHKPTNDNTPMLYFDHFSNQIMVTSNQQGITISSSSATVVNLHTPSYTNGNDIAGIYVGQTMSNVGQEFGCQNFDNLGNGESPTAKFGLSPGSTIGPIDWPTSFGSTTTGGTGF